ncbi:MAG TPA: group II intron reverse transcriptase/maturase [Acidobacteriota bacterium]|nr:group II intron reverse transcriptase/maturase [Acidobacteriota bacterium]
MKDASKSRAESTEPASEARRERPAWFANISTRLARIAQLAKQTPKMAFTSLSYLIDQKLLRWAFKQINRRGAPGVDGVTAAAYEAGMPENLEDLERRFKTGRCWAPPVRRSHIPKGDGSEKRPIGIPTLEDKVLQCAVTRVLTEIYERDFLPCSFGFRPKRSAHQALQEIWDRTMEMGGCWLLDVDIRKFFDTLDHGHLREFLRRRVRDGVVLRMIDKWLKAGVFEDETLRYPKEGTPQGGVISPLLANIYLHYVLDEWFESEVKPRLQGRAFLVRYADDFVMGFEREDEARKVLAVLSKRLERFGLSLHPKKTRLVDFRRPGRGQPDRPKGEGPARSFDFLGFTHHWGRSRKGKWVVRQRTATTRLTRTLKAIATWCRRYRHLPVAKQHRALRLKLLGHYNYYGLTGNWDRLAAVKQAVERIWHKWLDRRSQGRHLPWDRFRLLLQHYPLPPARVVHSVIKSAANP